MEEQKKENLYFMANFLISMHSKQWLCEKIGFTQHTLNRRLVDGDWKASEELALGVLYRGNKKPTP